MIIRTALLFEEIDVLFVGVPTIGALLLGFYIRDPLRSGNSHMRRGQNSLKDRTSGPEDHIDISILPKPRVSRIPLVLGLRTRMYDHYVICYVVFVASK